MQWVRRRTYDAGRGAQARGAGEAWGGAAAQAACTGCVDPRLKAVGARGHEM